MRILITSYTLKATNTLSVHLRQEDALSFLGVMTLWFVSGTSLPGLASGYWLDIPKKVGTITSASIVIVLRRSHSLQRGPRFCTTSSVFRFYGWHSTGLEPENRGLPIHSDRPHIFGWPPWLIAITPGLCCGRFYASHLGSRHRRGPPHVGRAYWRDYLLPA